MNNETELLKISKAIENKLKKMPHYILMPLDVRKSMVDNLVKIVMKTPHK